MHDQSTVAETSVQGNKFIYLHKNIFHVSILHAACDQAANFKNSTMMGIERSKLRLGFTNGGSLKWSCAFACLATESD